jgi:hypothetical protein
MNRSAVRRGFLAIVVALALLLAGAFLSAGEYPNARYAGVAGDGESVVPPRENVTVIATQRGDQRSLSGELVAFAPDGSVLFETDRHSSYWDVDPSPEGAYTVTYVATTPIPDRHCSGLGGASYCRLNVIERLNLTTGDRTRLYAHRADHDDNRWHDVDRIDEDHFVVGAIGEDSVFVVNVSSGIRTWTWTAESHYDRSAGGNFHDDWTHINDVGVLPDGRIMVDVRNMDQVVFLEPGPGGGVQDEWTLGRKDDYSILREQHNPDYIPEHQGGPAVIVADSENNRVVEYQREDGEWRRSWYWRDDRLHWPRDADRLPNGHTLITDTIGDRVLEVDRDGEIVWSASIDRAYEAERLGTGDESTGGPSAAAADLPARGAEHTIPGTPGGIEHAIRSVVPIKVQNGLLGYFFPWWVGFGELLAIGALVVVGVVWAGLELRWVLPRISVRSPIAVDDRPSRVGSLLAVGAALAVFFGIRFLLQFF